jgi:hypothetical protein
METETLDACSRRLIEDRTNAVWAKDHHDMFELD